MDTIANIANWIIGLFAAGAGTLWAFVSGVIPLLLVMLTFMNALVIFVGEENVDKIGRFFSKSPILRYTILPLFMGILFTGGGNLPITSKLIPEKSKPGYADVNLTFMHPSAGLFPHVHASEVWVYLGLATGISAAGFDPGAFAVRAILVCIPIMLIRGVVTEKITVLLLNRKHSNAEQDQVVDPSAS